jgi:hypothetical protein
MSSSKKIDLKRTLRQMCICLRPRPPYSPLTQRVRVYSILIHTWNGGGGSYLERRLEGHQFTKLVEKKHD